MPSYREHKPSGQAVVTLSGKDVYLGPFGSRESRSRYDTEIASWLARGRTNISKGGATISGLSTAYSCHAADYYRKNGRSTSQVHLIKNVLDSLARSHGPEPVAGFTAMKLITLRTLWASSGLARSTVNKYLGIAKGVFKWGVTTGMVPSAILAELSAVPGLALGRSQVKETRRVKPVPGDVLAATLAELAPTYRDRAMVQVLTGMRPGEVCGLRPSEVDRSGDVWVYVPATHKNEHKDKDRVILIGPAAQAVLSRYMDRDPDSLAFPKVRQLDGAADNDTLVHNYRSAIAEACARAGVPRWSPNRLRHNAATKIRKEAGIEQARIALGHSSVDMTEIYAEKDLDGLKELVRRIG